MYEFWSTWAGRYALRNVGNLNVRGYHKLSSIYVKGSEVFLRLCSQNLAQFSPKSPILELSYEDSGFALGDFLSSLVYWLSFRSYACEVLHLLIRILRHHRVRPFCWGLRRSRLLKISAFIQWLLCVCFNPLFWLRLRIFYFGLHGGFLVLCLTLSNI